MQQKHLATAKTVRPAAVAPVVEVALAANQPPTVPPQLCVSRVGCADMLDVSVRTVDRMIAADEIPVHRVRGKAVRFLRSDVEAYLTKEKRKAETLKTETSLPHPGPPLPLVRAGEGVVMRKEARCECCHCD